MDFTDAYRLSSSSSAHRSFAYSTGSTFFATIHHLPGEENTVVQVRVSTSLQVIRSWNLDFYATLISWSKNGTFLLIVGKKEFIVLSVDPSLNRRLGSDDWQGVVARVVVGMEGLSSATWVGHGSHEAVCAFSADEALASIYDVQRHNILSIASPKRAKSFASPTTHHLALLTRQSGKDTLVILASPDQRHCTEWKVEEQFHLTTNDAVEAAWSPNERYIAVREGSLEYKVQIYSPLGHLQSIFQIDSTPTQTQTSFQTLYTQVSGDLAKNSGGGLGVREMKWSPKGSLLALGGYDESVRILESTEWEMMACLDLSQKTITGSDRQAAMGPLMAWREPPDWRRETGGRGIVTYDQVDTPCTVPSLRIDMSDNTSSRSGISWMEWNHDGTLLGVRNDNHPAAIYLYAFPAPTDQEDPDQRIKPYLISVVMLSSAVVLACWKPSTDVNAANRSLSTLATITAQGQSIHLWHYQGGDQIVEAIPIPIDDFQPLDFAYAPDGNKILLTSNNDTYCCAIEAQEDNSIISQSSHL